MRNGFGLERDGLIRWMAYYSDTRCSPSWSEKEIAHKADDAIKKYPSPDCKLGDAPRPSEDEPELEKPAKVAWPGVEGQSAAELHRRIGQVRCVGDEWFVERSGVWAPTDRDM